MPAERAARRAVSERACLECQKRKTKCVPSARGGARPCAYCTKAGRPCVLESPKQRTPLTRRNLDEVEERCRRLEAILQDVAQDSQAPPSPRPGGRPGIRTRTPAVADTTSAPYEWNEELHAADPDLSGEEDDGDEDDGRDGMAAVTSRGGGSGYLGVSSGHGILQSVASLLPSQLRSARRTSRRLAPDAPVTPSSGPSPNLTLGSASSSGLSGMPALFSASNIQQQLIDAYFLGYNSYYPILHEPTFRLQCQNRKRISASSSWHVTYYAVLAIGEWVSGVGTDDNSLYYEAARSRLTPEIFESGSLNTVQAFLLLGNYLQKRDRPNTGYNYIGVALRMAMGLGLHRELPVSSTASPFEQHRRRVLFWTLYCFDCWFNITTGRPALLSESAIEVGIPTNVDESQYTPSSGAITQVTHASTCSAIIALARLTKIASRIYSHFMRTNPGPDIEHETSVMEQMIKNWRQSLPSYFLAVNPPMWFIGPRQVVLWKETNLVMVLLLLSQRHSQDDHDKLAIGARCQATAAECIADIALFCQERASLMHSGVSWYAVYFLLQAMLSFSAQEIYKQRAASRLTPGDGPNFEQISAQAQQCLQSLSSGGMAADRSLRMVLRLRDMVRQSVGTSENASSADAAVSGRDVQTTELSSFGGNTVIPFPPETLRRNEENILDPMSWNCDQVMDSQALPDLMLNEWSLAADPSLYALFDGMDSLSNPPTF